VALSPHAKTETSTPLCIKRAAVKQPLTAAPVMIDFIAHAY
jgi:hypothetical protein|tara:strand:- start:19 stop:141 length:123 start_codon:yes stop_codon:yes gene_type:complete